MRNDIRWAKEKTREKSKQMEWGTLLNWSTHAFPLSSKFPRRSDLFQRQAILPAYDVCSSYWEQLRKCFLFSPGARLHRSHPTASAPFSRFFILFSNVINSHSVLSARQRRMLCDLATSLQLQLAIFLINSWLRRKACATRRIFRTFFLPLLARLPPWILASLKNMKISA